MIQAHDNGGADDNHLPPGDRRIDWEQFLRDLIHVRFRGAFVFAMAGQMASRAARSELFARCRKTPGHWRCDGGKFRNFCAVKAKRRLPSNARRSLKLTQFRRDAWLSVS